MSITAAFQTIRPSFLALAPICILLGYAAATKTSAEVDLANLVLIFIAGIMAHISVNTLNEYFDFKSGLDFKTEKTPFSGGSGALPENPHVAKTTLLISIISLLITIAIGVFFLGQLGPKILPIGLIGVLLIITYTQWLNRSPLLCLVAPGLGFGVLMVVGTHVLLTGQYSPLAWLLSLVPFFLINNLLLLNQYPDISADAEVGREPFPLCMEYPIAIVFMRCFLFYLHLSSWD